MASCCRAPKSILARMSGLRASRSRAGRGVCSPPISRSKTARRGREGAVCGLRTGRVPRRCGGLYRVAAFVGRAARGRFLRVALERELRLGSLKACWPSMRSRRANASLRCRARRGGTADVRADDLRLFRREPRGDPRLPRVRQGGERGRDRSRLKAGTNCGSCVPELRKIASAHRRRRWRSPD